MIELEFDNAFQARHLAVPMSQAFSVDPKDAAADAAARLRHERFDQAPVVDGDRILGVRTAAGTELRAGHVVAATGSRSGVGGWLPEAARLLRRAVAAYRAAEETRSAGKALIQLAEVQRTAGRPEEAVGLLREAAEEIDPAKDHKLLLCARHNLANALVDLDQCMEARRVFRQTRPLYQRFQDPWTRRRRLWLAGRIDLGLGQIDAAARRLEQARAGFLEQEIVYDAALVSLDLAAVYARQGRAADLRRLAREMLPVFNARGVHREARRALGLFQQAAEVELVTVGLVQRLLAYLHRARHDPELRFEM